MAWNRSNGPAAKPTPKKPSALKGALAGLVVVAAAGAVVFFMMSGKDVKPKEKVEKDAGLIKEVKAAPAPKAVATDRDSKADLEAERQKRRELFKSMTPEQRLAYLEKKMLEHPLRDEPSSNRIFSTGVEQVMDWVFSRELGSPPPMLPKISTYERLHLAEILIRDNPIKETDSERAKYAKETVQMAKKEFREFIKQGGDPDEFLPYYHGQLVAAHQEWQMAQRSIFEVLRSDPDIAPEYLKKVNDGLVAKGIKKVSIPLKLQEKYGLQVED